jgi:hypothetical protein
MIGYRAQLDFDITLPAIPNTLHLRMTDPAQAFYTDGDLPLLPSDCKPKEGSTGAWHCSTQVRFDGFPAPPSGPVSLSFNVSHYDWDTHSKGKSATLATPLLADAHSNVAPTAPKIISVTLSSNDIAVGAPVTATLIVESNAPLEYLMHDLQGRSGHDSGITRFEAKEDPITHRLTLTSQLTDSFASPGLYTLSYQAENSFDQSSDASPALQIKVRATTATGLRGLLREVGRATSGGIDSADPSSVRDRGLAPSHTEGDGIGSAGQTAVMTVGPALAQ